MDQLSGQATDMELNPVVGMFCSVKSQGSQVTWLQGLNFTSYSYSVNQT